MVSFIVCLGMLVMSAFALPTSNISTLADWSTEHHRSDLVRRLLTPDQLRLLPRNTFEEKTQLLKQLDIYFEDFENRIPKFKNFDPKRNDIDGGEFAEYKEFQNLYIKIVESLPGFSSPVTGLDELVNNILTKHNQRWRIARDILLMSVAEQEIPEPGQKKEMSISQYKAMVYSNELRTRALCDLDVLAERSSAAKLIIPPGPSKVGERREAWTKFTVAFDRTVPNRNNLRIFCARFESPLVRWNNEESEQVDDQWLAPRESTYLPLQVDDRWSAPSESMYVPLQADDRWSAPSESMYVPLQADDRWSAPSESMYVPLQADDRWSAPRKSMYERLRELLVRIGCWLKRLISFGRRRQCSTVDGSE